VQKSNLSFEIDCLDEARFFAGSGVFLDDAFFGGFIYGFLKFRDHFARFFHLFGGHQFFVFFDRILQIILSFQIEKSLPFRSSKGFFG